MSRSASGLAGTFSRSPAPPARQTDKGLLQGPCAGQEVLSRHLGTQLLLPVCAPSLPTPHMGVLSGFSFFSLALTLVCLYLFICFHIKTEIIKSLTRHYWGKMSISGQLRELQSLRRLHCALCEVCHCVWHSLCALFTLSVADLPTHQIPCYMQVTEAGL